MQKLLVKLGGTLEGPYLLAIPLLLLTLFSAPLSQAEACNALGPVSVASISPSSWGAGQTFNIVIAGSFPGQTPDYPGCYFVEDFVSTTQNPYTAEPSQFGTVASDGSYHAGILNNGDRPHHHDYRAPCGQTTV